MTIDEVQKQPDGKIAPSPSSPHNRFVLLSVLAVVVLVTVYLLKKNMEPPPSGGQAQQSATEQQASPEQAMQEMMAQVEHIKDVLASDSSNYDAWVALGNMYFDANMPEESIEHYEQALALQSGDPNVMTDLATMKRATGDSETAVEILQRVVETDSTFGQAWFNLGVIYSLDLSNNEQAVSAWKRFVASASDSPHLDAVRKEIERLESELGS